jgi:hypothetical protein
VLRFTTSVPSSCEALYGTAEDALDNRATDPDMPEGQLAVDHQVPLEDLAAATRYFWRARAVDANGETYTSKLGDFTTLTATQPDDLSAALQNVALAEHGASVTGVSSNFGNGDNDSTWGVNHVLDGQMSTEWATQGDGDDAWFSLDFGQERGISRFGFRSRKMSDGTSIIKSVQLFFGDSQTAVGPLATPDPDELYIFDFNSPVKARTVRLEVLTSSGGNTGAKEVQFFAR